MDEVVKFIKQQRAAGVADEQIRSSLQSGGGWSEVEISKAFDSLYLYKFALLKIFVVALYILPTFIAQGDFFDWRTEYYIENVAQSIWFQLIFVTLFTVIGYVEAQKINSLRIVWRSTLAAAALSLLNPMFWGSSEGHPSIPNIIALPFIFIGVFIFGTIGGFIATKLKRFVILLFP